MRFAVTDVTEMFTTEMYVTTDVLVLTHKGASFDKQTSRQAERQKATGRLWDTSSPSLLKQREELQLVCVDW